MIYKVTKMSHATTAIKSSHQTQVTAALKGYICSNLLNYIQLHQIISNLSAAQLNQTVANVTNVYAIKYYFHHFHDENSVAAVIPARILNIRILRSNHYYHDYAWRLKHLINHKRLEIY